MWDLKTNTVCSTVLKKEKEKKEKRKKKKKAGGEKKLECGGTCVCVCKESKRSVCENTCI